MFTIVTFYEFIIQKKNLKVKSVSHLKSLKLRLDATRWPTYETAMFYYMLSGFFFCRNTCPHLTKWFPVSSNFFAVFEALKCFLFHKCVLTSTEADTGDNSHTSCVWVKKPETPQRPQTLPGLQRKHVSSRIMNEISPSLISAL